MKKFFIGGNWKENGDTNTITSLVNRLNTIDIPQNSEVLVAPPFLYLQLVKQTISTIIQVSSQNCSGENSGAFTGEVSPVMLLDIGISWVIIGHSERRIIFHENDQLIRKKVANTLSLGLNIILCVGETLNERESNKTEEVIFSQLSQDLELVNVNDMSRVVIAYEPVWAIGTGKNATPEQAQATHLSIRNWLSERYSPEVSLSTRIIYGGSVKGNNCNDLAKQPDVDGFLVGGASLVGDEFEKIIKSSVNK